MNRINHEDWSHGSFTSMGERPLINLMKEFFSKIGLGDYEVTLEWFEDSNTLFFSLEDWDTLEANPEHFEIFKSHFGDDIDDVGNMSKLLDYLFQHNLTHQSYIYIRADYYDPKNRNENLYTILTYAHPKEKELADNMLLSKIDLYGKPKEDYKPLQEKYDSYYEELDDLVSFFDSKSSDTKYNKKKFKNAVKKAVKADVTWNKGKVKVKNNVIDLTVHMDKG